MKQVLFLLAAVLLSAAGFAQSNSGIALKVLDESGEGLINWVVKVYQGGREVMTTYTDDDGEALAKPLTPNSYEIRVELNGVTRSVANINLGIAETQSVTVDFRSEASRRPATVVYMCGVGREKPFLKTSGNATLTAAELEAMPVW